MDCFWLSATVQAPSCFSKKAVTWLAVMCRCWRERPGRLWIPKLNPVRLEDARLWHRQLCTSTAKSKRYPAWTCSSQGLHRHRDSSWYWLPRTFGEGQVHPSVFLVGVASSQAAGGARFIYQSTVAIQLLCIQDCAARMHCPIFAALPATCTLKHILQKKARSSRSWQGCSCFIRLRRMAVEQCPAWSRSFFSCIIFWYSLSRRLVAIQNQTETEREPL